MNKSLDAFNTIVDMFNEYANKPNDIGEFFKFTTACQKVEKALKALEIIKSHIISPEYDVSGVYMERHIGLVEPYYEIKLREGVMCCLSQDEYDLLKEVLK